MQIIPILYFAVYIKLFPGLKKHYIQLIETNGIFRTFDTKIENINEPEGMILINTGNNKLITYKILSYDEYKTIILMDSIFPTSTRAFLDKITSSTYKPNKNILALYPKRTL